MTLVYAKIINMCGAGPGTGGWGQGVGVKGGQGGVWNWSQVTAAHILLWVEMLGCGGGAMMGWGWWWGRGVGRGFYWSFEQNRCLYFQLGCRNARYDTKSYTKSWEIPDFWGNPPVMTSHSRKYVIISPKKSPKWEGERFHLIIYARRSSHLGKLKNWLTSNF